MSPIHPDNLTVKVKRYASDYLMFLKLKWNGDVKGRECDDGYRQRFYKLKQERSSPTFITN